MSGVIMLVKVVLNDLFLCKAETVEHGKRGWVSGVLNRGGCYCSGWGLLFFLGL